jgi:type I restriction enzyme, S subunit
MMSKGKAFVPKLRFPEFRGKEQWREKSLKVVCEINPVNANLPESFIYIDLEAVEGGVLNARKRVYKHNAPSRAQRLLKNEDVVFQIVRPYQRNNLFVKFSDGEAYVASTGYAQLRAKEIATFLFQAIHTDKFVQRVVAKCTGSSYPAINSSDLADVLLPLPTTTLEQQKIADCLSSLDDLIAAQKRKVEALKTYKHGLMQQLFPREGETIPRLRFTAFRDTPRWRNVKAGTLFVNRTERGDDSLTIYSVTMHDGMVKRASLDRRIDDLAEATGNKKVYQFDLAYNMMRMWQGACGIASEDCMVSPAYVVLQPQPDVNSLFYAYLFKLPQIVRLFTSHSRGLTEDRLRLYYQDFSSISLLQPKPKEQEKIANLLTATDARIAVEADRLAVLQSHKNGLMQQLFPYSE